MKRTIITTIEATNITGIDAKTETLRAVYEKSIRTAMQEIGIGADDLHIKVQVFEHEEDDNDTESTT